MMLLVDVVVLMPNITIVDHDITTPLLAYKDRFFGMFESSLLASNEYNGLRLCGLHGLRLLILHANYLTENEVSKQIAPFILLDGTVKLTPSSFVL
jgi:DNA repair/transcription protein MET18/MMS19